MRRAIPFREQSFWAYHLGLAIVALLLNATACALTQQGPILLFSPAYAVGFGLLVDYPTFHAWWTGWRSA